MKDNSSDSLTPTVLCVSLTTVAGSFPAHFKRECRKIVTGCVYVCYAEQLSYTQISPMEIKETQRFITTEKLCYLDSKRLWVLF